MQIRTDDMKIAGELTQDLAEYLQLESLESIADFPGEMRKLVQTLAEVEGYNLSRMRLTTEMADNSNLIKTLVIKAEDSRLLNEM